jgi:hypothetical protein
MNAQRIFHSVGQQVGSCPSRATIRWMSTVLICSACAF